MYRDVTSRGVTINRSTIYHNIFLQDSIQDTQLPNRNTNDILNLKLIILY